MSAFMDEPAPTTHPLLAVAPSKDVALRNKLLQEIFRDHAFSWKGDAKPGWKDFICRARILGIEVGP